MAVVRTQWSATLPDPAVARSDESWEPPRPPLLLVKEIVAPARETLPGARRALWLAADVETYDARFRIRRPDGTAGPGLLFSVSVERGAEVVIERGSDRTGFLTYELRTDTSTMEGALTFTRAAIVGADVTAALPSIEFLQDFREPNVLQVSWELGEFVDYREAPPFDEVFPESLMEYLRALAVLRTHLGTAVRIPDLTTVSRRDARAVKDAGRLVAGGIVDGEWDAFTWATGLAGPLAPGRSETAGQGRAPIDVNRSYELRITEPLVVSVGKRRYTVGAMHTHLLSVRFVVEDDEHLRVEPFLNNVLRRIFAPQDPVPDRSQRPVQGRPLDLIDDETGSRTAEPETAPDRDHRAVYEALRDRVLLDALSEPVPMRLVQWHVLDESPFASPGQVWTDTVATVRTLLGEGLVNVTEQPNSVVDQSGANPSSGANVLNDVVAQAEHGNTRPTWNSGPWLTLTASGQESALSLIARTGQPPKPAGRRRRLHSAAAGRSGYTDSSERVDDILTTEVWR